MNYKQFRSATGFLLVGIIWACLIQSCKTNKILAKPQQTTVTRVDTVVVQKPVDSAHKPKAITEQEREQLIDKFYEYGYRKYYGPQFEKLMLVNSKLEADIRALTKENSNIRIFGYRKRDSLERSSNYYQEQAMRYQREKSESDKLNTSQQAKALEKSDTTLLAVNRTTKVLSMFGIVFGTFVVILIIVASYLWKKNKVIFQELEYIKTQLRY